MTDAAPKAGRYSIGSDVWPGLSKLIEETGELQQVMGKLIATNGGVGHFDGSDLDDRLVEEIGDVLAAVSFFVNVNNLDWSAINKRSERKQALFHSWQTIQGGSRDR